MVFVRQNQGRTISIPTWTYNPRMVFTLFAPFQDGVFVKNQPKNLGWTFITFPCACAAIYDILACSGCRAVSAKLCGSNDVDGGELIPSVCALKRSTEDIATANGYVV